MPKGVDHTKLVERRIAIQFVQKSLMPKGVDHYDLIRAFRDIPGKVQKSLMPKGVDHSAGGGQAAGQPRAKIFDAERR